MFTYAPPELNKEVMEELETISMLCEGLLRNATYKTGSITISAMAHLRLFCDEFRPVIVAEVGTFVGRSTLAMVSSETVEHIFTCDKDNDCLNGTPVITVFPKTTSTKMFEKLLAKDVLVDMFFFDGRILPQDIALILRLSGPRTLYVFDDYEGQEKGFANVEILRPYLKGYVLIEPPILDRDPTKKVTIAALIPKDVT